VYEKKQMCVPVIFEISTSEPQTSPVEFCWHLTGKTVLRPNKIFLKAKTSNINFLIFMPLIF